MLLALVLPVFLVIVVKCSLLSPALVLPVLLVIVVKCSLLLLALVLPVFLVIVVWVAAVRGVSSLSY